MNVLAVMDSASHKLGAELSGQEYASDLIEARAAVAELIEAAHKVAAVTERLYVSGEPVGEQLGAALARCTGGR